MLHTFRSQNHPQQTRQRGASLFPEYGDITAEGDDRGTDPALFAQLNERFHFTLDVAASAENAKCHRYFDKEMNGLTKTWAFERVWCNPPYSELGRWVKKAWDEASDAELIVMLLPANRTEQDWWQKQVEPYRDGRHPSFEARTRPGSHHRTLRVEFLAGRPRFVQKAGTTAEKGSRPPFGCCLLIWESA